jgi:hypothetical protein
MKETTVNIDSFNPYDSIFPNRKLVTKEILILIKTLRQEGYNVIVSPDDDKPIEYLFKKDETSFLSDPSNQLLISIPISIITGLLTNWIQKLLDKKGEPNNIIIINHETNIICNSFNKIITKNQIDENKKKRKVIKQDFEKCLKTKSPIPGLPFPILLEHKPIIIGWCRLHETDIGIEIEKGIITDKKIYKKLKQGKFNGASVTGIAKKSICNICDNNYSECNHISGEIYNGKCCTNNIIEADLIEVSIVKKPININTFVKLV